MSALRVSQPHIWSVRMETETSTQVRSELLVVKVHFFAFMIGIIGSLALLVVAIMGKTLWEAVLICAIWLVTVGVLLISIAKTTRQSDAHSRP